MPNKERKAELADLYLIFNQFFIIYLFFSGFNVYVYWRLCRYFSLADYDIPEFGLNNNPIAPGRADSAHVSTANTQYSSFPQDSDILPSFTAARSHPERAHVNASPRTFCTNSDSDDALDRAAAAVERQQSRKSPRDGAAASKPGLSQQEKEQLEIDLLEVPLIVTIFEKLINSLSFISGAR